MISSSSATSTSRSSSGTPNGPVPRKATRHSPLMRRASCSDAGGRLFLDLGVLADAHQLFHRFEVVDVEDPVEVVDLVLQGPGEQLLTLHPELLAVPVLGLDGHLGGALDLRHEAWHR